MHLVLGCPGKKGLWLLALKDKKMGVLDVKVTWLRSQLVSRRGEF